MVVVVNPTKVDNAEYDVLTDVFKHEGVTDVTFSETTIDDPGIGQARQAVADGVDLVIAWGGDGTVMACVTGIAGSDTPLAILAGGTGNLLARNLEIPVDFADGVHVAVHGVRRRIDVGVVGDDKFAVMAGIGFDAALLRDASEEAKARVGSAAYVVSGMRNLTRHRFNVTVTVDDNPPVHARARTVLVGNVGKLQGGLPVLRDAVPDDGLLDVLIISPRTKLHWVGVALRVIIRRTHPDHMECMRGRRVLIESQTVEPYELDGDLRGETDRILCEIEPGSLLLCVPSIDKPKPGL